MRTFHRRFLALLALTGGGTLFQVTGCARFAFESAAAAFDTCAVVNCTSSTFFDFCSPVVLLVDCPNLTTTP